MCVCVTGRVDSGWRKSPALSAVQSAASEWSDNQESRNGHWAPDSAVNLRFLAVVEQAAGARASSVRPAKLLNATHWLSYLIPSSGGWSDSVVLAVPRHSTGRFRDDTRFHFRRPVVQSGDVSLLADHAHLTEKVSTQDHSCCHFTMPAIENLGAQNSCDRIGVDHNIPIWISRSGVHQLLEHGHIKGPKDL